MLLGSCFFSFLFLMLFCQLTAPSVLFIGRIVSCLERVLSSLLFLSWIQHAWATACNMQLLRKELLALPRLITCSTSGICLSRMNISRFHLTKYSATTCQPYCFIDVLIKAGHTMKPIRSIKTFRIKMESKFTLIKTNCANVCWWWDRIWLIP